MKKLLTLTLTLLMAFSLCLTVSADGHPFEVDGSGQGTLQDAIQAALESSNTTVTIKMLGDYTTGNPGGDVLYIDDKTNGNKDIVLDLNGKTLTVSDNYIVCREKLTITDNSTTDSSKWGKIETSNHQYNLISVNNGGELILERGTINNNNNDSYGVYSTIAVYGKNNYNGAASNVNIKGGYINSSYESCIKAANEGAGVEVNGGTLNSGVDIFEKDTSYSDKVSITVKGGTFTSDVSAYLASDSTIVKYGDKDYKVYGENDKVTVDENTKVLAALSGAARSTINNASSVKVHKVQEESAVEYFTGSSFTKFDLSSNFIEISREDAKKVEGVKIDNTTIEGYIPLNITLGAYVNTTIGDTPAIGYRVITDLGENVQMPVTLYLSESIAESLKDKIVRVIRIHDGVAELLDENTTKLTNNALTFNSGKFSTYVIAYGTSLSSGGNTDPVPSTDTTTTTTSTKSYDAKDKNKDGVVSCEEEMDSANWVWSTTKNACVYKVTNTSSK